MPLTKNARAFILALALDILLAAGLVGGSYFYNYKVPRRAAAAAVVTQSALSTAQAQQPAKELSWAEKFKEHFSDTVISTDTTYKSPTVSVELKSVSYDSGALDFTNSGKHVKYGTKIAYTLADIYISDITCLQTAFAQDTYGVGFGETLASMSARLGSVLAVNGDSYSNNRHQDNGTIIRNGTVYRAAGSTEETCVLFRDGAMKIYAPDQLDPQRLVDEGAWQSWVFGPSLLDENGNAKTDFNTWDYIRQSHPRTAIGYYEPGHYCLLLVDGRRTGYSRGMTLEEMSQLFASLGCKAAYNLDGGHSSSMTFGAAVVSRPYKQDKEISDGIFIREAVY